MFETLILCALLTFCYAIAAIPGVLVTWWLLKKSLYSRTMVGIASALSAGLFVAPSFAVFLHMPVVVPFAASPFVSNTFPGEFFFWNTALALAVALVMFIFQLRSNSAVNEDAPKAARPSL